MARSANDKGSMLVALEGLRTRVMSLDAAGTVIWVNIATARLRESIGGDSIAATAVGSDYLEVCRRAQLPSGPLVIEALHAVLSCASTYVELDCDLALGRDRRTQLTLTSTPADSALVTQIDIRGAAALTARGSPSEPVVQPAPEPLTARERAVLGLMARGLDNQSIASDLGVGYATVRSHVRSIMAKLGARSRLEAVIHAAELDLVRLPLASGAGHDGAARR